MPRKSAQPQSTRTSLPEQAWMMISSGQSIREIAKRLNISETATRALIAEYRHSVRSAGLEVIRRRNKTRSGEPTNMDFVEWCKTVALPRLAQLTQWPIGITRRNYFDSDAVSSYSVVATCEIGKHRFAEAHKNGDSEAIHKFAKVNRMALKEDWVIRQLVAWRLEGTGESKRQFDKFMKTYWQSQGKRSVETNVRVIAEDVAVYADSLLPSKGNLVNALSAKHIMSRDRVKLILKMYRKAYSRWKCSLSAKLWLSTSVPSST